jgi:hypothetical protein
MQRLEDSADRVNESYSGDGLPCVPLCPLWLNL